MNTTLKAETAPQKNDLSEIWTELDIMDDLTFPPLNKSVLLSTEDGARRGWYKFSAVKQRRFVCTSNGYTHWRGELKVDFLRRKHERVATD